MAGRKGSKKRGRPSASKEEEMGRQGGSQVAAAQSSGPPADVISGLSPIPASENIQGDFGREERPFSQASQASRLVEDATDREEGDVAQMESGRNEEGGGAFAVEAEAGDVSRMEDRGLGKAGAAEEEGANLGDENVPPAGPEQEQLQAVQQRVGKRRVALGDVTNTGPHESGGASKRPHKVARKGAAGNATSASAAAVDTEMEGVREGEALALFPALGVAGETPSSVITNSGQAGARLSTGLTSAASGAAPFAADPSRLIQQTGMATRARLAADLGPGGSAEGIEFHGTQESQEEGGGEVVLDGTGGRGEGSVRHIGRRGSASVARQEMLTQPDQQPRQQAQIQPSPQLQQHTRGPRGRPAGAVVAGDAAEGRGGLRRGPLELGFINIDIHTTDPQACTTYAMDIYGHLRLFELRRRPNPSCLSEQQAEITPAMRAVLVDWLVEVADQYRLVPDTLYLTVNLIDRYLSIAQVSRAQLQLLGVACMLIASKYEEIYAPQVDEFCYITDNTYRREEVLEMERMVLNKLHFQLSVPTVKTFLRRFNRAAQADLPTPSLQLEFLGNFLGELTLVDYGSIRFLPSLVAASAICLARLTLWPNRDPWTTTMQHYSGYTAAELYECASHILDLQRTRNTSLPAVREKYRQAQFQAVSALQPTRETLLRERLAPAR